MGINEIRVSHTVQGMGCSTTYEATEVLPRGSTTEDAQQALRALAAFVDNEVRALDAE